MPIQRCCNPSDCLSLPAEMPNRDWPAEVCWPSEAILRCLASAKRALSAEEGGVDRSRYLRFPGCTIGVSEEVET